MKDTENKYEAGKVIAAFRKKPIPGPGYEDNYAFYGLEYEKIEILFHGEGDDGDILLISLKERSRAAVLDAINTLSANPYVLYAEPDYREQLHSVPNDPLYQKLWGIKKIGAPHAWNYTIGSSGVAVGVIDTGIKYTHPDIRRNMWVSPNRQLFNGKNFAENSMSSMDLDGHGTHVAGTIGAVGNNCMGITGVCWNVRVVSMKFGLDIASAIAAIDFANQYHIPILNASWGGRAYSRSLKQAIDGYHGLLIASAGNDGTNNDLDPVFPASYDCENIISVAATDPEDNLAGFSNYGENSVDLAAPGTNILSLGITDPYSAKNGTSMSAPHVAGAAALLKSYLPSLSPLELKELLLTSAVRLPSLAGRVATGGILNLTALFELANYMYWKG